MTAAEKPTMAERWEELHRQPRFRPRYPHEQVVRWTFRNIPRVPGAAPAKVLDLGCGAGRHALFLAAEGYDAYASDISRSGLEELEKAAQARGLAVKAELTGDLSCFQSGYFDAVISYGVLYYLPFDAANACVRSVHRILKPGGSFLCVTRTYEDGRRNGALPGAAPFTWHLRFDNPDAPSDAENGMEMLFLPKPEVERMFSCFETVVIDRMSYQHGDFTDDDWVISAMKASS